MDIIKQNLLNYLSVNTEATFQCFHRDAKIQLISNILVKV